MNFIGKSFVLLYGAGSIFCLVAAMAVYTQRLNFVTPKEEGAKKAVTLVDESIARTKDLLKANNRAYTRWMQEYEEVVNLEVSQFQRREFYRGQLELLRSGKFDGADRDDPVQELPERDPVSKLLSIDKPTGRTPVKVSMQMMMVNALPESVYLEKIKTANKDIKDAQDDIAKLEDKIRMTTDAKEKLSPRIAQQEDIAREAIAEREYLEDFVTNRRADAQLYVKRRDALQASIDRLKAYYKKTGGQGN
jgi:hypothetical protein